MSSLKVISSSEKEYDISFANSKLNKGTLNGKDFEIDIIPEGEGRFHILHKHRSYTAEIVEADYESKTFTIKVNNNEYELELRDRFDKLLHRLGLDELMADKLEDVKAPMPGKVLDVNVKEGDEVQEDQPLLVLEAMKMENVLKSPSEGVIKTIEVESGVAVEKNQVLITFEQ